MIPNEIVSHQLRWEQAKDLLDECFDVLPDEGEGPSITFQVTEVAQARTSTAKQIQFWLVFKGPAAPLLPQRMYRMRHARLGDYAVLVTALSQTAEATEYQACFSHAA
jgi:hypothetical protein